MLSFAFVFLQFPRVERKSGANDQPMINFINRCAKENLRRLYTLERVASSRV